MNIFYIFKFSNNLLRNSPDNCRFGSISPFASLPLAPAITALPLDFLSKQF